MPLSKALSGEALWAIFAPALVGVVLLGVWEAACRVFQVPQYLFPTPSAIAASFQEHWPYLLKSLLMTVIVTLQAFTLAVIIGTLGAFLFVQSRFAQVAFFPYVVLLQVTPIVAIAPLIIIL